MNYIKTICASTVMGLCMTMFATTNVHARDHMVGKKHKGIIRFHKKRMPTNKRYRENRRNRHMVGGMRTVRKSIVMLVDGKNKQIFEGDVFNVGDKPIWSNKDAHMKCPVRCNAAHSTWTKHWKTTVPGKVSICKCQLKELPR